VLDQFTIFRDIDLFIFSRLLRLAGCCSSCGTAHHTKLKEELKEGSITSCGRAVFVPCTHGSTLC